MKKMIFFFLAISCINYGCSNSFQGKLSSVDSSLFVKKYLDDHVNSPKEVLEATYKKNEEKILNENSSLKEYASNVFPAIQKTILYASPFAGGGGAYQPITASNYSLTDTIPHANKILRQYLTSFYAKNGGIKSFMIRSDSLQNYINFAMNKKDKIVNFRLMIGLFFDSLGNSANTMVCVGLDSQNNYVSYINNKVLEHCLPCPTECPNILNPDGTTPQPTIALPDTITLR